MPADRNLATHRSPAHFLGRFEAWLVAHPILVCVLLYLVALGLRLVYLRDFHTTLVARVPLMDEAYYQAEAWNRVRGAPPASDVHFMTPLYPWFLSLVFRVVGGGPIGPFAVQLALGAFAAPLTVLVGRHALRPLLSLLAALAVANFAPLVFFEALFLVEGLVLLALLGASAASVATKRLWIGAAIAGLGLGVAVLGRGSNLLLALPLGAWFWLGGRTGARTGRRYALLAFLAGLVLIVGPLAARNMVRTGKPLLLTANAGFNLYVGNGPEANGIFVRLPGLDLQQDPLTLRYVQRQLRKPVGASAANDWWTARTRDWVRSHPGRTLKLFAWKLLLFWNRMSIPQVEGFESAASGTALARAPFFSSFAFLPLALVGTWLALASALRRVRRREFDERSRTRAFLAMVAVTYGISIAIFFVTDRYRVPILPILFLLAACALDAIAASFASGRRRWLPALALVVLTAFVLTEPSLLGVDRERMRRDMHVHAALRLARGEQFDAALREYRAAVDLDPEDPEVLDGMARMLARAGQDSLALLQFRSLLQAHPDRAVSWYNYGNLLRRLGRRQPALEAYRRSTQLEVGREAAWNHMGEVYRALGDTAQAAASYRQALEIVPAYEQALNNLATLRASQGDAVAAEQGWRAALAANPRSLPALVNLAILMGDMGKRSESLDFWKKALAVDPGNETVRRMVRELDPSAALPPVPPRPKNAATGSRPADGS